MAKRGCRLLAVKFHQPGNLPHRVPVDIYYERT